MELFENLDPLLVKWLIIPLLIFTARILDVSLGTLRIVFISRGEKKLAPILGFFEVLIWIVAIGQVMKNLSSPLAYFAWAGGFAAGNYIGLVLEQKLALGQVVMRVISTEPATQLMELLNGMGFRTIIIDADSNEGRKNVLFSIIRRKRLNEVISLVRQSMPNAFFTIEGVQQFSDSNTLLKPDKNSWYRRVFPVKKAK